MTLGLLVMCFGWKQRLRVRDLKEIKSRHANIAFFSLYRLVAFNELRWDIRKCYDFLMAPCTADSDGTTQVLRFAEAHSSIG